MDNSSLYENLTTENLEIEINGLQIFTAYKVAVAAFNQIGIGVFSDPQDGITEEHGEDKHK